MRRALGTVTTYLLIGLAIIGALTALVFAVTSYVDGVREEAFTAGQQSERAKWRARESAELASANAKIVELNAKVRAEEKAKADAIAAIDASYQKELSRVRAQKDRDVAAARAGALRLRDPGRTAAHCESPARSASRAVAGAASGSDGPAGAELSPEASAFLLGIAGEADEVVAQLTECQAVIRADRGGGV